MYDVRYGLNSYSDLANVRDFFIRRLGSAHSFRFKDPTDYSTQSGLDGETAFRSYNSGAEPWTTPAFDDVQIGVGDGTQKLFRLLKKYTDAVITRTRTLSKPIAGTVKSGVNGVEKTDGSDWTVDTTTGWILYTVPPPAGHLVTAGCEFDVPVHFSPELEESAFMISFDDFGAGSVSSIELLEELHGGQVADEFFFGGSATATFGADQLLGANSGRVIRVNPAIAGLALRLPETTDLEPGAPWFFLVNIGGNSVDVQDFSGASVFTLAAGAGATVLLTVASSAKVWRGV